MTQQHDVMGEPVVVPIGHLCPTAGLLRQLGLRRLAMPLDWSRSTLALWQHALSDDLRTLEDEPDKWLRLQQLAELLELLTPYLSSPRSGVGLNLCA